MKVINIFDINESITEKFPPLTMALGFFDGIHVGHEKVLEGARRNAQRVSTKLAVMTFRQHPKNVLGGNGEISELTSLEDKLKVFEEQGFDYAFVIDFTTEFANLEAKDFVEKFLVQHNVKFVTAGFDFAFGKNGSSDVRDIFKRSGGKINYEMISEVSTEDKKISSTRIRQLIKEGRFAVAKTLMNRDYSIYGEVVHGEKRGRTIGFPTANVELNHSYVLPDAGVYVVKFTVTEKNYYGVCSIGHKPTFHDNINRPIVEVNLFDFDGDIYGENVAVTFFYKIRSEKKFNGIDELVKQINVDVQVAKNFFEVK